MPQDPYAAIAQSTDPYAAIAMSAPSISKPTVAMQPEPMSWLQQRGAQTAENAVEVAKHVFPAANSAVNDIYTASAPNIAQELYKRLKGEPNKLHEIPAKAVMTWLAAGGIPESSAAEPEMTVQPTQPDATPSLTSRIAKAINVARNPGAVYPGAPEPSATPEQLNPSLVSPARTLPGQIAPEKIAPEVPIPGVNVRPSIERVMPPRSGLQLPPAPKGAELAELPATGAKPVAATGEALKSLAELPRKAVYQAKQELGPQASVADLTARANKLHDLLNKGLGGKALEPTVPLKNQGGIVTPKTEAPAVLEGHTPVDSSAIKSYKYDAKAHEIEIGSNGKNGYIYGDVSPEQAESFVQGKFRGQKVSDPPSFGKAWNDLRNAPGVTPIAKIVNGKRIAIPRVMSDEDLISPDEWQAGHELSTAVEGSPRQ